MKRLHCIPDDFEAVIKIYTADEGGRLTPPFNGIRWDFAYAEDPVGNGIYMVHPDFVDDYGDSLPPDQPLPIGVELNARMTIGIDAMREAVHRSRIREGQRFYCQEGAKRVAEGRVTRITSLFDDRPSTNKPIT